MIAPEEGKGSVRTGSQGANQMSRLPQSYLDLSIWIKEPSHLCIDYEIPQSEKSTGYFPFQDRLCWYCYLAVTAGDCRVSEEWHWLLDFVVQQRSQQLGSSGPSKQTYQPHKGAPWDESIHTFCRDSTTGQVSITCKFPSQYWLSRCNYSVFGKLTSNTILRQP